ncbi:MAG: hypothetical protein AB8F78_16415 [Saprospiraceae bacterium]
MHAPLKGQYSNIDRQVLKRQTRTALLGHQIHWFEHSGLPEDQTGDGDTKK